MKTLNKVTLVGYVATEPEITVEKDVKVAKFTIATNRTDKKNQVTDFHSSVASGNLADVIEDYVKKGKGLYIEGSLQNRTFEDTDGKKRYATEIILSELNLLTY